MGPHAAPAARTRPRRRSRGSGRPRTGRNGAGRSGARCGDETPKRTPNRILAACRSAAKRPQLSNAGGDPHKSWQPRVLGECAITNKFAGFDTRADDPLEMRAILRRMWNHVSSPALVWMTYIIGLSVSLAQEDSKHSSLLRRLLRARRAGPLPLTEASPAPPGRPACRPGLASPSLGPQNVVLNRRAVEKNASRWTHGHGMFCHQ